MAPPEILDADSFEPEIEYLGCKAKPRNIHPEPIFVLDSEDEDPEVHLENSRPSGPALVPQKRHLLGRGKDGAREKKWISKSGTFPSLSIPIHPKDMPQHVPIPNRSHKRKREIVLDLSSDFNDEVPKKFSLQRPALSDSSDLNEDYANILASLDDAVENWQPFKEKGVEYPVVMPVQRPSPHLQRNTFTENIKIHCQLTSKSRDNIVQSVPSQGQYIWTKLRTTGVHPRPTQSSQASDPSHSMRSRLRRSQRDFRCHKLELFSTFRQAPGPINKISQSAGTIVICSSTIGGQQDEDDDKPEQPNTYNGPGSLMVWHTGKVQIIHGHERYKYSDRGGCFRKYYTVNDATLETTSNRMVTSGNDKVVRIWSYNREDPCSPILAHTITYDHVPRDISFKKGDTIFAVTCDDGQVHVYPNTDTPSTQISFLVAPADRAHTTGATEWGSGGISHHLFTSSEPINKKEYRGFHRAFDLNMERPMYEFDAKEAGDTMALTHNGERLVIFTEGAAGSHIMRMYDVRRKNGQAVWTSQLAPFPTGWDGEVNRARFSSDAIYLAVSRNDDVTHVYDARMIGRGILHVFEHTSTTRNTPGVDSYGIMEAYWVENSTRRLGLMTGGNDGCVRIWDVGKASDDPMNGEVIAETDSGVCHFSLGHHRRGEKALVVGDSGGRISIFDQRSCLLWEDFY